MSNCQLHCESAISEVKNAILYLDSINASDKNHLNLEKYMRLSESEVIAGKRMLEFSEVATENALNILDTICQKGAKHLNYVLSQTQTIYHKLDGATKQINFWLYKKEKREKKDWITSSQTLLIIAKHKLEKLKIEIEKANEIINNCPGN